MFVIKIEDPGIFNAMASAVAGRAKAVSEDAPGYAKQLDAAYNHISSCENQTLTVGEMTGDQMEQTLKTMTNFGGHFVQSLVETYQLADATNRAILRSAFADIFIKYGPNSFFQREA